MKKLTKTEKKNLQKAVTEAIQQGKVIDLIGGTSEKTNKGWNDTPLFKTASEDKQTKLF